MDAIDNLDFSQEYQVIYTSFIVKALLIARKHWYGGMKWINFEENKEIFDTFEEENRIVLMESILTVLQ